MTILAMTKFSRVISEVRVKEEILPDGTIRTESSDFISYRKDGKHHRVDGPALIGKKMGHEAWYQHGLLHRIDGPALIDKSFGVKEYWVNGKELSKEEFKKHFGNG